MKYMLGIMRGHPGRPVDASQGGRLRGRRRRHGRLRRVPDEEPSVLPSRGGAIGRRRPGFVVDFASRAAHRHRRPVRRDPRAVQPGSGSSRCPAKEEAAEWASRCPAARRARSLRCGARPTSPELRGLRRQRVRDERSRVGAPSSGAGVRVGMHGRSAHGRRPSGASRGAHRRVARQDGRRPRPRRGRRAGSARRGPRVRGLRMESRENAWRLAHCGRQAPRDRRMAPPATGSSERHRLRSRTSWPRRSDDDWRADRRRCAAALPSRRAIPVLSKESRVALTLRVVGGLTTEEIARMLLMPVPTIQARITRAKKSLAAAHVPFETPDPSEWTSRVGAVLGVIYLIFTEGYAATAGEQWVRPRDGERGAAARPDPNRPPTPGAGSARARRADGVPGLPIRGARGSERGAHSARRPGPRPLGSRADREGTRSAGEGGCRGHRRRQRARRLRITGRDRPVPRDRAQAWRRPTGSGSCCSMRCLAALPRARSWS